jgi:hypothetical protein
MERSLADDAESRPGPLRFVGKRLGDPCRFRTPRLKNKFQAIFARTFESMLDKREPGAIDLQSRRGVFEFLLVRIIGLNYWSGLRAEMVEAGF